MIIKITKDRKVLSLKKTFNKIGIEEKFYLITLSNNDLKEIEISKEVFKELEKFNGI